MCENVIFVRDITATGKFIRKANLCALCLEIRGEFRHQVDKSPAASKGAAPIAGAYLAGSVIRYVLSYGLR